MATQNVSTHSTTISATFTDEELFLLEGFAAEQGIEDLSAAIPLLLHELVRIHDEIWDAQLEHLPESLVKESDDALAAYEAGELVDCDPNDEP